MVPVIRLILVVLSVGSSLFMIGGAIDLFCLKKCTKVEATIIDYRQEYTSRGFMWRKYVEYEFNGVVSRYITMSKTFKRKTGTVNLYITKKGRIVEVGLAVERLVIGLISTILLIALTCWMWNSLYLFI